MITYKTATREDALQFKRYKSCSVCSKEDSPIGNTYNNFFCISCWSNHKPIINQSRVSITPIETSKTYNLFD